MDDLDDLPDHVSELEEMIDTPQNTANGRSEKVPVAKNQREMTDLRKGQLQTIYRQSWHQFWRPKRPEEG